MGWFGEAGSKCLAPAFLALYQAFQTAAAKVLTAKTAYDEAISLRDAARGQLMEGMHTRAAYVQTESGGNASVIISSGLNVRRNPTPVGPLPPPVGLKTELNSTAGVMTLKWKPVRHARGYIVEYSPDVQPRVFTQLANTTRARAEVALPVGEVCVFRVAASGGSTGQSYFSPEVTRGVA